MLLAEAITMAAALRIVRFHVNNEFSDWIAVLHTFSYANALHQMLKRAESPEMLRGVYHGAMRVYLDRFLNVPPARPPDAGAAAADPLTGPRLMGDINFVPCRFLYSAGQPPGTSPWWPP